MPIFDSHTHAFPDTVAARAIPSLVAEAKWIPVTAYHNGTLAGLLASMDRAGIAKAVMCSVATRPTQVTKITDWSAAIASERIIPFPSIHPDFDQPEAEVARIAALGLRGLKFHPQYMNCAADDPRTLRIAQAAAAAGLALVMHCGYDLAFERDELAGPRQVRALHDAVPGLRLLACHLGGWRRWEESLEFVVGRPIYLETSFCFGHCPPALFDQIIAKHPREYLLFGSDSPWADQTREVEHFRALPLPADTLRRAMWDNVFRFAGVENGAANERE